MMLIKANLSDEGEIERVEFAQKVLTDSLLV